MEFPLRICPLSSIVFTGPAMTMQMMWRGTASDLQLSNPLQNNMAEMQQLRAKLEKAQDLQSACRSSPHQNLSYPIIKTRNYHEIFSFRLHSDHYCLPAFGLWQRCTGCECPASPANRS